MYAKFLQWERKQSATSETGIKPTVAGQRSGGESKEVAAARAFFHVRLRAYETTRALWSQITADMAEEQRLSETSPYAEIRTRALASLRELRSEQADAELRMNEAENGVEVAREELRKAMKNEEA